MLRLLSIIVALSLFGCAAGPSTLSEPEYNVLAPHYKTMPPRLRAPLDIYQQKFRAKSVVTTYADIIPGGWNITYVPDAAGKNAIFYAANPAISAYVLIRRYQVNQPAVDLAKVIEGMRTDQVDGMIDSTSSSIEKISVGKKVAYQVRVAGYLPSSKSPMTYLFTITPQSVGYDIVTAWCPTSKYLDNADALRKVSVALAAYDD